MSSNGSNASDNIRTAVQIAVSQVVFKSKEWSVPRQQTATVATVLWIVVTVGLILNTAQLIRFLTAKKCLLPSYPAPPILVNLCLSNLLLVLGVFLAALTLSFDLGDSGVKAGEVELFFTVVVLLQSWLGQIMILFCSMLTRKKPNQAKIPENSLDTIGGKVGKWRRAQAMSCSSTSRQPLYQPCRRHSRLTQTLKRRQSATYTSANGSREIFAAVSVASMSRKERQAVGWWLVWSWLLSFSAATALLMTKNDRQDACLTLTPFQTTYMIPGEDVYMVRVSENMVNKVPFMLVLVPVYVAGLGCIIWSMVPSGDSRQFPSVRKHRHTTAEGGEEGNSSQAHRRLSNFRSRKAIKEHTHETEQVDMSSETHKEESACNVNVNEAERRGFLLQRERKLQRKETDLPKLREPPKTELGKQYKTNTKQCEHTAVSPSMLCVMREHCPNTGLDDSSLSQCENCCFTNHDNTRFAREEKRARVLSTFDDSVEMGQLERKLRDVQHFPNTEEDIQTESGSSSETSDNSLLGTEEYMTQFNDEGLQDSSPDREDISTFTLKLSTHAHEELTTATSSCGKDFKNYRLSCQLRNDMSSRDASTPQNTGPSIRSTSLDESCIKVLSDPTNNVLSDPTNNVVSPLPPKKEGEEEEPPAKDAASGQDANSTEPHVSTSNRCLDEASRGFCFNQSNNANSPVLRSDDEQQREAASEDVLSRCNGNKQFPRSSNLQERQGCWSAASRMPAHRTRSRERDADFLSSSHDKLAGRPQHLNHHHHHHIQPVPQAACRQYHHHHHQQPEQQQQQEVQQQQHQGEEGGSEHQGRGRAQGGLRPAIHIVSSSMHHFTIQGGPPSTGHFELYPSGWLNQGRLRQLPHPRDSRQQSLLEEEGGEGGRRRHGGARSRLSSRSSQHRSAEQSCSDRLQSGTHQNPPLCRYAAPEEISRSRNGGTRPDTTPKPKACASCNSSLHDPKGSDDTRVSVSEPSRQASLAGWSFFTAEQPRSQDSLLPRQQLGNLQSWAAPQSHYVSDGDRTSATLPVRVSESSENRSLDPVRECDMDVGGGDTHISDSKPKRDSGKRWWVLGDRLSYKVKCCLGLVMHLLCCVPFAVTLAPGVFEDRDCGSRLLALLVVRMMMFFHVVVCPLWMAYCFPRHAFANR